MCYVFQIVLEFFIFASDLSVVLGTTMLSKSATINSVRAVSLYPHNENDSTVSLHQFRHESLAITKDESQHCEIGVPTLEQNSGTNRIKLCRKKFNTTTDVYLLVFNVHVSQLYRSGTSKFCCRSSSVT